MVQEVGLKRKSVLFWLVALLASAFVSAGVRFLFAPLDATEGFGVPVDGSQQSMAYLWALGLRDIVAGLLGFALLALRVSRRVLAAFVGIVALIPSGDLVNVYANTGTDNAVSLLITSGTAVFAWTLAFCLWKGAREHAAEPTAAQAPLKGSSSGSTVLRGTHTALLVLLLAGPLVPAAAQQGRPYKVSEEQVRNLLQRLEERADAFRSVVDIVLEVSRLEGTPREDRLDLLVEEFEREVDTFEERFNKHISTKADVERLLRVAERVNAPLTRALADQSLHPDPSLRERAQSEWTLLKSSLSNLADFYNIQWRWPSASETSARADPDLMSVFLTTLKLPSVSSTTAPTSSIAAIPAPRMAARTSDSVTRCDLKVPCKNRP